MAKPKKNFIGLEGFIWWIGVVEDRQDPEQLGRVRVRCFGWHTDEKEKIPTDSLPWAQPVVPVNYSNFSTPKEGDMVFGFFVDGDNAQQPAIMGVIPGKPLKRPNFQTGFADPRTNFSNVPKKPDDAAEAYPKSKYTKEPTTNRLSRGKEESTIISTRKKNLKKNVKSVGGVTWNEPNPTFKPVYPYNNAYESESGHALEFDDTPNNERVHLAHRKGSFIEIDKDGNRVEKVVKDNYTLVMGSDHVFIAGKCSVTVDGDCNLKVGGNLNIGAEGDVRIKGKRVFMESTSTTDIKIGGEAKITSGGKLNLKGSTAVLQGAVIDLPAAQINMQSGSAASASGTGLTGGGKEPTETEVAAATEATQESAEAFAAAQSAITSTAQDVVSNITGSALGKAVSGITSTIDNTFSTVTNAANSVLKDFTGKLPVGELSAKVSSFENLVNDNKGSILSLRTDLQNSVKNKIGEVATKSVEKNIEFNVDSQLLPESTTTTVKRIFGKRIYPSTESIETEGDG